MTEPNCTVKWAAGKAPARRDRNNIKRLRSIFSLTRDLVLGVPLSPGLTGHTEKPEGAWRPGHGEMPDAAQGRGCPPASMALSQDCLAWWVPAPCALPFLSVGGSGRIRSLLTEAAGSKGCAQGRGGPAASAEPQATPRHSPSRRTCPCLAGGSVRPRIGGLANTPASQRPCWAVGPLEPEGAPRLGSGASARAREAVERPQTPEASRSARRPPAPRPLQGQVPTSEARDERLSFPAPLGPQA